MPFDDKFIFMRCWLHLITSQGLKSEVKWKLDLVAADRRVDVTILY